ncbi:probable tRNA (uracil-O(2)-)-methyltransferase [Branchiostoma lanceolatum]|uniref:probable tRNA (uracil-O(2)-)-methyltransferase n=1 Tax=Branchiostoma lanceolatum TaxID=7740 RepID=UPI003455F3FF
MAGCELLPEAAVTRVGSLPTAAEPAGFWSGVAVWVDKPHVVNRRLTGAKEVARIWTGPAVISSMLQNTRVFFAGKSEESLQKKLGELKMEGRNEAEGDDLELIVRDLLPRQLERAKVVREIIVLDHPRTTAWFIPLGTSGHGDTESELSYKSYRFVYAEDISRTGKTIALDILSRPGSAAAHSPEDDGNCSPGGSAAHSPEDDGNCSPGGAAAHSPEDDGNCSPGGAAAHSPEDDGICSPGGAAVHSPEDDGNCSPGGAAVHSPEDDGNCSPGGAAAHSPEDDGNCSPGGAAAHSPEDDGNCSPGGAAAHSPEDDGNCSPGGAAAHSPEDDGNCSPGGAAVHSPKDDGNCSPGGAAAHSPEDDGNCSPGGAAAHSPEDDGICSPTTKWLCDHLLPKVAKWSEQTAGPGRRRVQALVPLDRYNVLYQQLKRRHGRRMVQIWPDVTTTDPEKFVYEDIAIATYLLLLWEEERGRLGLGEKQSFVDLGCGNGLLVHILAQEGHPGKGIDVRKRTTWDIYGQDTVLQEEPITPSDNCLFPDYDWLIGNHSDELTPWIPVIAARSSHSCRYFVLPCCPYDFHGRFARTNTADSHYRNYLDYVCSVGRACGFIVEEDSLRIPSTRRICHVGRTRIYPEEETDKIDQQIRDFISSRPREQPKNPPKSQTEVIATECLQERRNVFSDDPSADSKLTTDQSRSKVGTAGSGSALWDAGFQPRARVEAVRNCNRLEEALKDRIVNTVGLALLNQGNHGNNKQTSKQATVACQNVNDGAFEDQMEHAAAPGNRSWNKGGSLQMSEVVSMFEKETLQKLKCECGGIKTLLKNKNQVFILRGDSVRLRDWSLEEAEAGKTAISTNKKRGKKKKKTDRELRVKTSLCWFYLHHPDGCPKPADNCYYAHGPAELRHKP